MILKNKQSKFVNNQMFRKSTIEEIRKPNLNTLVANYYEKIIREWKK